MTSCCKHTLDSYDKSWQQLVFILANQLADNTLSALINVLAKQINNQPHSFVLTSGNIYRNTLTWTNMDPVKDIALSMYNLFELHNSN